MTHQITIPNPDVPIADVEIGKVNYRVKIDKIWYRKFVEWLQKTNQDSLGTDGKLTVTATSDTNLRFSYRGSDGVTRVADLTLA